MKQAGFMVLICEEANGVLDDNPKTLYNNRSFTKAFVRSLRNLLTITLPAIPVVTELPKCLSPVKQNFKKTANGY